MRLLLLSFLKEKKCHWNCGLFFNTICVTPVTHSETISFKFSIINFTNFFSREFGTNISFVQSYELAPNRSEIFVKWYRVKNAKKQPSEA